MDSLTAFFNQEQQRIFKPSPDFCGRVMSRMAQQRTQPATLWDTVFAMKRPILAAALSCILILIGMDMMMPVEPSRGPAQIYLESELNSEEELLYLGNETPPTDVVFQELIPIDWQ